MGQEMLIIARVGEHYRNLAAVHLQSLPHALVLTICLRLTSIFTAPANRRLLELELGLAADYYKDHEAPSEVANIDPKAHDARPARFPFIGTCLLLGVSTSGLESNLPRSRMVHYVPEDIGFDTGKNKDITVLDITHLANVRYCFAAWRRIGDQDGLAGAPPPLNEPWTAAQYVQHYTRRNPSPYFDQMRNLVVAELAKFPLVPVSALAGQRPLSHPRANLISNE